jgi:hypothetical protein
LRACFARVMSVHMCISVDASQHRLNHKSLISPNFIMRQTLRLSGRDIVIEDFLALERFAKPNTLIDG